MTRICHVAVVCLPFTDCCTPLRSTRVIPLSWPRFRPAPPLSISTALPDVPLRRLPVIFPEVRCHRRRSFLTRSAVSNFPLEGWSEPINLLCYQLSGAIAGDAKSPPTVLGPVDFDFTTKFNSSAFIEIFFPTKVNKVGFWLNPSLGNAVLIATDTNFAFSGIPETTLETGTGTAGNFVGIERTSADIGGFKIIASGATGFTIDDFTFGGGGTTPTVPEPAALVMMVCGLLAFGLLAAFNVRTTPDA